MSLISAQNPWRKSILHQLQERNKIERLPYECVINTCNNLIEKIDTLQREKVQLENNPALTNEKIIALNNEIKEHKRQANEDANTITELRAQLETERKEKAELKTKLDDNMLNLDASKTRCHSLEKTVHELETQLVLVNDEHTALQIAYSSLKDKHAKIEQNYNDLVTRWMALKAKDADNLNEENERAMKIQNEKMKKDLEEAVSEINVDDDGDEGYKVPNRLMVEAVLPKEMAYSFEAHDGEVNALNWDHRAETLYSGGGDRKVKLWQIGVIQQTCLNTLTGSNASITSIDHNEEFLVASSNDYASRVWSKANTKFCRTFTGHSNKVYAVKFLRCSNNVISGSADRTLKIWDINKHTCMRTIFASSTAHDLVNIDCDGPSIASAHYDKKIRFWDTRIDGTANDIQLQGIITSLDVSSDDRYILTSVRDDSLKCLDLRMNQVIRDYVADGFKIGSNWTRAKFSPDDRFVACGANDGSVYIWDFLTAKLERTLPSRAHSNQPVLAVEWGPEAQLFLSADRNKKIVVWR